MIKKKYCIGKSNKTGNYIERGLKLGLLQIPADLCLAIDQIIIRSFNVLDRLVVSIHRVDR